MCQLHVALASYPLAVGLRKYGRTRVKYRRSPITRHRCLLESREEYDLGKRSTQIRGWRCPEDWRHAPRRLFGLHLIGFVNELFQRLRSILNFSDICLGAVKAGELDTHNHRSSDRGGVGGDRRVKLLSWRALAVISTLDPGPVTAPT